MKVALPGHFSPEPADRALSVHLRQQPQSCFHSGPFRASSTAPHGLPHQAVVDIDIRAQCLISNV
jgi:hypothetical protein